MIYKKRGNQSVIFEEKPLIRGRGTVVGQKEGEGPLAENFDIILKDDMYGEKSWEKAESKMLKEAMLKAVNRAGITEKDIDVMLSGDLLNQLMSSSFMARDLHIPFLGLYGACSTMTESLVLGSMLIDGGFAKNVLVGASSHFCTAERQFRMPVEHGNQRPPSAQWTATAAGSVVVSAVSAGGSAGNVVGGPASGDSAGGPASGRLTGSQAQADSLGGSKVQPGGAGGMMVSGQNRVRVEAATIGKVIDAGIKDANQMGAAMAPAAVDTLLNHLEDTGRNLDYYDLVVTGDLGFIGKDIMMDLLADAGINKKMIFSHYDDCGTMLFTKEQDVHGGGSGCGCSASVFAGFLLKKMEQGKLKKLLLMSTGAMLSTISPLQGESIPGIAHAVSLEVE